MYKDKENQREKGKIRKTEKSFLRLAMFCLWRDCPHPFLVVCQIRVRSCFIKIVWGYSSSSFEIVSIKMSTIRGSKRVPLSLRM
jgi:hypothetical protein